REVAHREVSDLARGNAPRLLHSVLQRVEHATGVNTERVAGGRQLHPAARSVEEGEAQLALQGLDLPAQRGLRDRQAARRAAKVPLLRHREEVAQVPQLHPRLIPPGYHLLQLNILDASTTVRHVEKPLACGSSASPSSVRTPSW